MKRIAAAALCLLLFLSACSKTGAAPSAWQEQYDLGIRYLGEGNYEEAIIAFTAAIEIDPKNADAYLSLAEVYIARGDADKAAEILRQAIAEIGETEALSAALAALQPKGEEAPEVRTEREDYEDGTYEIREYIGNTMRVTYYNADDTVDCYWIYEFDDAGRQVLGTRYNADDTVDKTLVPEFDAAGKQIGYAYHHADGRVEAYELGEGGYPVRGTVYDPEGKLASLMEFDSTGNLIRETHYNPDGSVAQSIEH